MTGRCGCAGPFCFDFRFQFPLMHQPHGTLRCGRFRFSLSKPLVMAILNVTPDSFSDGGRFLSRDAALRRADTLIAEGADLIDIGGESTRPGAPPLSLGEELDRVLPIVEALRDRGIALSVDTYKPEVMRAALDAGADMINDIRAFSEPDALEVVARRSCAVCAMHMRGDPRTMQVDPVYDDVVAEVREFLDKRVIALESAGVARDRIVVDPGFGFGKTVAHNYRLLRDLPMTSPGGLPILVGMSRKSMLAAAINTAERTDVDRTDVDPATAEGVATEQRALQDRARAVATATAAATGAVADAARTIAPAERVNASIAAAVCAAERGAAIIRVHDVAATVEALAVWQAINAETLDGQDR